MGKRNIELNLPNTSSLSISLGNKGTKIKIIRSNEDKLFINGKISNNNKYLNRLYEFINLFRKKDDYFYIYSESNIPIAAGVASSASFFAAITKAFDKFYGWNLSDDKLSIIARIGSGSASRSIYEGFVLWNRGQRDDGLDSYAEKFDQYWSDLCIGLIICEDTEKKISSRDAMNITVNSSPYYINWPNIVTEDIKNIKIAIKEKNFSLMGEIAELNSNRMHALMLSASPSISYFSPETIKIIDKVKMLRSSSVPVYYTQDAGPNIKIIFEYKYINDIIASFKNIEIIRPFSRETNYI